MSRRAHHSAATSSAMIARPINTATTMPPALRKKELPAQVAPSARASVQSYGTVRIVKVLSSGTWRSAETTAVPSLTASGLAASSRSLSLFRLSRSDLQIRARNVSVQRGLVFCRFAPM